MSVPVLRGNVLFLSSGSLVLIHVNAEVCWEERDVSVTRESLRKSGQSGLWVTEKYMECSDWPDFLQLCHITDTVLSLTTYLSIQVNQNHSLRRWKQYVTPKRRKTRLPKKTTIKWSRCLTRYLSNVIRHRPANTITNIIAPILLYVTILQKKLNHQL